METEENLARWNHEEELVKARLASAGIIDPRLAKEKSGLEILQSTFSGELPPPPIGETLDFIPIQMAFGEAVFQGRPQRKHYNPLGSIHGGWIATLLDSAVACAVHSTLPPGKSYTTIELKVNMVRTLTDRVSLVRAEGKVIHRGGQVATAEGRLIGPDGKLYAHATTTCLIFDHSIRYGGQA